MAARQLVVGLGNPGKRYMATRHNLGAMVVEQLARRRQLLFKQHGQLEARVARWESEAGSVFLLLSETYMNESGRSVKQALDYWQIPLSSLLVVVDDADLDLGELRFRERGSSGGHKGLADIQSALNSLNWGRLRLGIGRPEGRGALEGYVLDSFSADEIELLPPFIEMAVRSVETWSEKGSSGLQRFIGSLKNEKAAQNEKTSKEREKE